MSALIHFEAARAALTQAGTIDEVTAIRDKAAAARVYAQQARLSLEMQNQCAELKLRAERRAGEILRETVQHGGDRAKSQSATLTAIGLTKSDSSRWQRIAGLPDDAFESYVSDAKDAKRELTTAGALKLAKRISNQEAVDLRTGEILPTGVSVFTDLHALAATGEKFGTVYADPAWSYGNQGTRASTDDHYATMSVQEICDLPVPALAAESALCWLWTTTSFAREAFDVLDAWGFEYKSEYIWVKPQMGMGNYMRVSHEKLYIGSRGKAKTLVNDQMSWGEFPRGAHSAKPEPVRSMIERCSSGPFLEMFARRTAPGWTSWGNQVERGLFDEEACA